MKKATVLGRVLLVAIVAVAVLAWIFLWFSLMVALRKSDNEAAVIYWLIISFYTGIVVISNNICMAHPEHKFLMGTWKWFKIILILFSHLVIAIGTMLNMCYGYWNWISISILIYLITVTTIYVGQFICCCWQTMTNYNLCCNGKAIEFKANDYITVPINKGDCEEGLIQRNDIV